jgi:phage baseplate assembly protein W
MRQPGREARFYGRGPSWSLHLTPYGGIAETAGIEKVEQSLRIILGTQHGERVMRPEFGCNLRSLAFAPRNLVTATLAKHLVEDGLQRWEPRIDVLDVRSSFPADEPGALVIELDYRLRTTQDVRTLVYPFYLQGRPV